MSEERTVYRACHLCEAICGLEITVKGRDIISIRGDVGDPFSRGHICPKGVALKDTYDDPNRLRLPQRRIGNTWTTISWDEAFELAATRLAEINTRHGDNAIGFYAGNPSVHNIGTLLNVPGLIRTLKTRQAFSATSVDQLPQQLVSLLMFGHQFMIPIPDIDHTDFFLILGGNPLASNGSMMTVPDVTKRLAAIRQRGGKVVVVDPRRTETAEVASEHIFIRPGADAALLMAMINVIISESRQRIRHADKLNGLDQALAAVAPMTPAVAAPLCGIEADTICRLAREFASANRAICYGRIGTTLQAYGTLNQWLVQLMNIVTGNLDQVGGTMPTQPVIPLCGPGTKAGSFDRWRSRVRGLPEFGGELPSAALAEEILTPGDGQIRALITTCGNPVLSTPNGTQLERALESLDFMVSIDIYQNETTRFADLILPPTSSLNHDHYDLVFNAFAIRNVTRFNSAIWARPDDERYDWEIFGELSSRLAKKMGRDSRPAGSTEQTIAAMLAANEAQHGLSMAKLKEAVHGLDLGSLQPSLMQRLQTPDSKVQCAPAVVVDDVARFMTEHQPSGSTNAALLLIGRRHVRNNNSWMHNSHRLIKGKARDQLLMHPDDLASRQLADGQTVQISSIKGHVKTTVQASDSMMPGVVCLPHGFGHHRPGTRLGLAESHAGASYNDLADETKVDAVSGNAALNGLTVDVCAVS